jgi:hypothetical protein
LGKKWDGQSPVLPASGSDFETNGRPFVNALIKFIAQYFIFSSGMSTT